MGVNILGCGPLLGSIVFVLTVLWGHHITWFWHENWCFLSHICASPVDPTQRTSIVRMFPAFLRHSRRMLVLWSPKYFDRLWCNYECAVFMYLKGCDQIDFVPLELPTFNLAYFVLTEFALFVQFLILRSSVLGAKLSPLM